jgi:hypothetical protein
MVTITQHLFPRGVITAPNIVIFQLFVAIRKVRQAR